MTAMYPTTAERQSANAMARNFTEYAVAARRQDAQDAINDIVRGFRKLREAGADILYLEDAVRGLHDEASNIQARLAKDLDGVGVWSDELIDMTEINDLMAKVRT